MVLQFSPFFLQCCVCSKVKINLLKISILVLSVFLIYLRIHTKKTSLQF